MGKFVKMKQIFIFSFLFLCSILIVSSYSAGEELNLSYSNITNVTYPCLLINQSVYLSGNIPIGNHSCNITHNVTEQIIIDNNGNGGGGGGSRSRTKICITDWNCTEWGNCQSNNRATRTCNNLNECNATRPTEERYCYYYVPKIISVEAQEEVIEQVEVTAPPEQLEQQGEEGMAFFWWVLIGIFIVMVIMIVVYMIQSRESQ